MGWREFFLSLVSIFFILIVLFYWLIPFEEVKFGTNKNPSFNLANNTVQMQFYDNMRFPSTRISYSIEDGCSLTKKREMTEAFNILENLTVLDFFSISNGGQIKVTCSEKNKLEEGLFIAGEGGPTNITNSGNFNVIFEGSILLIRDSKCEKPNVAIHELLHVLGFNHSKNNYNIMYPISRCSQTIGEEIPQKINRIYSYEELPDLVLNDVSAEISGRYLDVNLSIKNEGLKRAKESKIVISAEEEILKEFELGEIDIGHGLNIELKNIWSSKRKIEKLKFSIENHFEELSKENNQIILDKKSN